jgi:Zn-dependent protease with chaperone function
MPQPLPYHIKVCEHFKEQKKTWDFFAAIKTRNNQLNEFKLELLKNTYKFDPVADKAIFDKVEIAQTKLGLNHLPVHIYQAQFEGEVNASIVFLEGEAHIVFSGAVTKLLNDEELLAVIAHELTHIKLYTMLDGDLEVAGRIITSIANNYSSEAAYYETARLFRLYTEVFCDRGAYTVVENTAPVITSLVKIATGLEKISAESYVRQAEEIFSVEKDTKAVTLSHPENFIRARALHLWHTKKEEAAGEIIKMIEGSANLDQLDIFRQKELSGLTRKYMQLFLKPKWFQTVLVLSQARQFFPQFSSDEAAVLTEDIIKSVSEAHISIREYFSYLLLDFALADPGLELVPFGWAFQFSEDVLLKDKFEEIVKKEFKFTDKKLQQHKQKALAAYFEVKESASEQIYQD